VKIAYVITVKKYICNICIYCLNAEYHPIHGCEKVENTII